MLDQRRRRWSNIVKMLYKCFMLAGLACLLIILMYHAIIILYGAHIQPSAAHGALHHYLWSLNLFVHLLFQLPWEHTSL